MEHASPRAVPAKTRATTGATLWAFAVSASGSVAALGAASWSGSSAMLSAAIVGFAAAFSQALILYGLRRSGPPPISTTALAASAMHFWSAIAAMVLFAAGAGAAIRDGVVSLLEAPPVAGADFALAVLGALFAAAAAALWRTSADLPGLAASRVAQNAPRGASDAVSITLAIELTAVLGASLLAAAGLAASIRLGLRWADGAASVAIGLVMSAVAAFLALELRAVLAGGVRDQNHVESADLADAAVTAASGIDAGSLTSREAAAVPSQIA
ncbi:MAG: hypothetical protein ACK4MF_09025, partial [Hyphomicrobiaceae bacterium]